MPDLVRPLGGGWITVRDGARIFYKDWGAGPPILFSHGWPLNADAWDDQMMHVAAHGFRAIAHDRRGHGRSSQTCEGNDLDTYADDLADLVAALELERVALVGHAAGGGEVAGYVGRYGTDHVAKVVLVAGVQPLLLRTPANPLGLRLEIFDAIRAAVAKDRAQFYRELSLPFYGANRPGAQISQGVRDSFWVWSMQAGLKAAYDGVKAFSETDLTPDLRRIDVPTLILHGDDDQIVPIGASAIPSSTIVKRGTLKIYPGAPHGLSVRLQDLMIRSATPEPLTVLALSPFDADACIGHGVSYVSINLLNDPRGGCMSRVRFGTKPSLKPIRLHDLHERLLCPGPGEDSRLIVSDALPLLFDFESRWRAGASRHETVQPLRYQEPGHSRGLLCPLKVEVLEAIEQATAPLRIDACRPSVEPDSIGLRQLSSGDARHPDRMGAHDSLWGAVPSGLRRRRSVIVKARRCHSARSS